jgi:hypothetical protein
MKEEFYIELEDGWWSVFGSNTGKCYGQFGSKEEAEEYIEDNT